MSLRWAPSQALEIRSPEYRIPLHGRLVPPLCGGSLSLWSHQHDSPGPICIPHRHRMDEGHIHAGGHKAINSLPAPRRQVLSGSDRFCGRRSNYRQVAITAATRLRLNTTRVYSGRGQTDTKCAGTLRDASAMLPQVHRTAGSGHWFNAIFARLG